MVMMVVVEKCIGFIRYLEGWFEFILLYIFIIVF